jgi:hypothetical protein
MLDADIPAPGSWLGDEAERLARSGRTVLVVPARPFPAGTEEVKSPLLGSHYLLSLRAMLVGRTLVGLRADDALRALEWLLSRQDVDTSDVTVYGSGPLGVVALHVAALDRRVGHVMLDGTILSWRQIVEQPVHRDASQVIVPNALREYDLPDLATAIAPRKVTILNPVDAMGNAMRRDEARKGLGTAAHSHVRLDWRGAREPLPLE